MKLGTTKETGYYGPWKDACGRTLRIYQCGHILRGVSLYAFLEPGAKSDLLWQIDLGTMRGIAMVNGAPEPCEIRVIGKRAILIESPSTRRRYETAAKLE